MDWIAHMAADLDDRMLGFVSWHMYADWRPAVPSERTDAKLWGAPDAPNGALFEALAMAQTPQYEARARGVGRLLQGRDILNVCGELNTVAHHEHAYTLGLNQNTFGAAYYASALIHLIRGGADLEMRWTAISKKLDWGARDDAYGLMSIAGEPTPACLAKQMFAQHVRFGDLVRFPAPAEACGCGCHRRVERRASERRVRQYDFRSADRPALRLGRKPGGLPGGPEAGCKHRQPRGAGTV